MGTPSGPLAEFWDLLWGASLGSEPDDFLPLFILIQLHENRSCAPDLNPSHINLSLKEVSAPHTQGRPCKETSQGVSGLARSPHPSSIPVSSSLTPWLGAPGPSAPQSWMNLSPSAMLGTQSPLGESTRPSQKRPNRK